jgi:general stress protein YciG
MEMIMANSERGFAGMDEKKQRDIASQGGKSVPDEKRSFSQDSDLAAEAGRKGGQSVPDEKRSFSQDRHLAAEAGRKGGESSHGGQQQASDSGRRQQGDGVAQRAGWFRQLCQ